MNPSSLCGWWLLSRPSVDVSVSEWVASKVLNRHVNSTFCLMAHCGRLIGNSGKDIETDASRPKSFVMLNLSRDLFFVNFN